MFGKKDKENKEKELKIKVGEWWMSIPYLEKLKILLDQRTKPGQYPEFNITSLEHIGVRTFWNYNPLERKIEIMQKWEKEKGGK